MSTDYQDEVLADLPLVYYRHDEVGAATNGDSITDLSGNDKHATLCYANASGTLAPYGQPSAIETDPSSRSFYAFSDSNSHVGSNDRSYVYRADSDLILPGDFSLECWVKSLSNVVLGTTFPLFGVRGSYRLGRTFGGAGGGAANFYFSLIVTLDDASTYTLLAETPVSNNAFYHVVGGRSGNTLFLRVNSEFLATMSIPGLPNGEGSSTPLVLTPCAPAGNSLVIGGLPFNDIHSDVLIDECALYDHVLSSSRVQIHYEAAINATLLNGFSNVVPTAILYSDLEPDPVNYPFRHNWDQNLVERISFMSGLSTTVSGKEEGNGVRPKPRREIEFAQVIRDNAERQELRAKIKAYQNRKWFIPILEHREQLLVPLSSGATSIPASTQYKDYEEDSYVHLRELNDAGQVTKSEYLQIESFTGSQVVPTTPTVNAYVANLSEVCPARRGYLPPSIQSRGHTAEVEELTLTARLLAEDESATPNRITAWTPTITYKNHEVHDPSIWQSNDWSDPREYDIDRATHDVDFETGIFELESDTAAAAEAFSYSVKLKGLEQIAKFLGWFYYHAGSLVYLWVASMQRDLTIVSALGSNLTVSGHIYTEIYAGSEARRDLAFVYNDNTMILRRINSSATSGANDILTLNTTVPTQTNLRSVSFLKFCRIDADSLEKALSTDDVMLATWRFRELLHSPD
jgi:hypothetical protein